jgi:hypothetical protein
MSYVKEEVTRETLQHSVREKEKQEWCDQVIESYLESINKDPNYREKILRGEFERMLKDPTTQCGDLLKAMDSLGKSSFNIGKHRLVLFPNG